MSRRGTNITATGSSPWSKDAKSRVREIGIGEFQRMRANGEEFLLIDVREESEWAAGHVAGAIHLGKGIIERDIETTVPDSDARMVLYCGGGYRSALAADAPRENGLHQRDLARWRLASLPVFWPSHRALIQRLTIKKSDRHAM